MTVSLILRENDRIVHDFVWMPNHWELNHYNVSVDMIGQSTVMRIVGKKVSLEPPRVITS